MSTDGCVELAGCYPAKIAADRLTVNNRDPECRERYVSWPPDGLTT